MTAASGMRQALRRLTWRGPALRRAALQQVARVGLLAALIALAAGSAPAVAAERPPTDAALPPDAQKLHLVIEGHRFVPAELHAHAGRPIAVEMENRDDTPEEFESLHLRKEYGLRGHRTGHFVIKPQQPGRYPFMGEFHAATARGVLIVE